MLDGILFLVREPIISVAPPKSMKVPGEVTPAPIIAHMPSIELIMTGVPADKSVCFAAFTVTNPVVRKGEPIVGNQSLGIFISARMLSDQFLVCISTPPVHQASRKSVLASPVSFRLMKSLAPRQRRIFRNFAYSIQPYLWVLLARRRIEVQRVCGSSSAKLVTIIIEYCGFTCSRSYIESNK